MAHEIHDRKEEESRRKDSSVTLIMINAKVYMAYVLVRTNFCVLQKCMPRVTVFTRIS